MEAITLRESGWGEFVLANLPAIEESAGTVEEAREMARHGRLMFGGGAGPLIMVKLIDDRSANWCGMWVLHDMCMRYFDRREAFRRLRGLGFDRRQAAEMIHDCERES